MQKQNKMVYSKQFADRAFSIYKSILEQSVKFLEAGKDLSKVLAKIEYLQNGDFLIFNLEGIYIKNASLLLENLSFMLKNLNNKNKDAYKLVIANMKQALTFYNS